MGRLSILAKNRQENSQKVKFYNVKGIMTIVTIPYL